MESEDKHWNRLVRTVVDSPSLQEFKRCEDDTLRDACLVVNLTVSFLSIFSIIKQYYDFMIGTKACTR